MLVLDSGGLSRLRQRTWRAAELIAALKAENLWTPVVPTVVLAESTSGAARRDTKINRFLKTCEVEPVVSERVARRAGYPPGRCSNRFSRRRSGCHLAEPGGTVLTGDPNDLELPLSRATPREW